MFQKSKKKNVLVQANLNTIERTKYAVEREELERIKRLALLNGKRLNGDQTDALYHPNAIARVEESLLTEFAKDLGHVTRVTEELGEHFFTKFHFKKKK